MSGKNGWAPRRPASGAPMTPPPPEVRGAGDGATTTSSLAERFRRPGAGDRGERRWPPSPMSGTLGRAAGVVEDVGEGVDGGAVEADFVVEVRAGGAAGAADAADRVAAVDALAGADVDLGEVAVAGGDAEAVREVDRLAVAAGRGGEHHQAVGGGEDGLAGGGGDVDPLVDAGTVGHGIAAGAEAAGQDAAHRRDGRGGGHPAHPLAEP